MSNYTQTLVITTFPDVKATIKNQYDVTVEQLIKAVENPKVYKAKADMPLIKLATFGDIRTVPAQSLRNNDNVLEVYGIEGDYDEGKVSIEEASKNAERMGLNLIFYTTSRHTKEAPRWRVLAPLANPIQPEERDYWCGMLNYVVGGILGRESFALSQSFYYGKVEGMPYESKVVKGNALDTFDGQFDPIYVKTVEAADEQAKPKTGASLTLDDARLALSFINPSITYSDWKDIGMALKDEFGDDGFALWNEWSAQDKSINQATGKPNYQPRQMRGKWVGFKGHGITIATLIYFAKEGGYSTRTSAQEDFPEAYKEATKLLEDAGSHSALLAACTQIRKLVGLKKVDVESLAALLKKRATKVGSAIDIKTCRTMLYTNELQKMDEAARANHLAKVERLAKTSPIIRDWVYLESSKQFFNINDGRSVEIMSFNMILNRITPPDVDGNAQNASNFFALNNGHTVYRDMYVPKFWNENPEGKFFVHEGIEYLNSYKGERVPQVSFGWEDRGHYKTIEQHILGLFDRPQDAQLLIQFFAHCVQKPGQRILWSPVVLGKQGDGKTTLARMMAAVMGQDNVRNIALDELYSNFSGWAEGACLRVIEEIRITGKSRHDVMNKLKPYITNDRVSVVKKGENGVDVLNTQNYLCFTNHADALVLDEDDRRWAVFATRFNNRHEVLEAFNKDYWDGIYDVIHNHAGDIRGWLLSVDISAFNPNIAPEVNKAKQAMINESVSEYELNIEEILGRGGIGFNENLCIPSYLNEGLSRARYKSMNAKTISKILKEKMGFVPVGVVRTKQGLVRPYFKESFLEANGYFLTHEVKEDEGLLAFVKYEIERTFDEFNNFA